MSTEVINITFNGTRLVDPKQLERECIRLNLDTSWVGLPNSFRTPRGKDPGIGWILLMNGDITDEELESSENILTFEHVVAEGEEGESVDIAGLSIVDYRAIAGDGFHLHYTPTTTGEQDWVVLVKLADKRFFGQLTHCNQKYNIRSPRKPGQRELGGTPPLTDQDLFYHDTLNNGKTDAWTWDEMLQDIWNTSLPDMFEDAPSLADVQYEPTPFATKPENYSFDGVNAWEAYNQILTQIGVVSIMNLDGTFSIALLGDDADVFALDAELAQSKEDLVFHDGRFSTARVQYPEKIQVCFRAADYSLQATNDTSLERQIVQPLYVVEINTVDLSFFEENLFVAGTAISLHDSTTALFDEDGSPVDSANLDLIAKQRAEEYVRRFRFAGKESIFTGFRSSLVPNGAISAVAWYDTGSGAFTQIFEQGGAELSDGPIGPRGIVIRGNSENNSPPDIARPTTPQTMIGVFRITEAEGIPALGVGEGRAQKGAVQPDDTDPESTGIAWSQGGNIVDLYDVMGKGAHFNSLVYAMWWWQTGRWIILGSPTGISFITFTLDGPLETTDFKGNAIVQDYRAGPVTDPPAGSIEVHNQIVASGDFLFSGLDGAWGQAFQGEGGTWYIIQLECPPQTP